MIESLHHVDIADALYGVWLKVDANRLHPRGGEGDEVTYGGSVALVMSDPLGRKYTDFKYAIPKATPALDGVEFGGLEAYARYEVELLDGVCDWEVAAGKRPYTYHERIVRTERKALNELRRNPNSRRAVIPIAATEDYLTSEPPCVEMINLYINGGKLDIFVTMRANEGFKAAPHNLFGFARLQEKWAKELGVQAGTYTHFTPYFYIQGYEWNRFHKYCERIKEFESVGTPERLGWRIEEYDEAIKVIRPKYTEVCKAREAEYDASRT